MKMRVSETLNAAIVAAVYFSSAAVEVPGPSPTISRTASSSLAPSQCTCLPKCVTKLPAGIGTLECSGSHLAPEPTHHVPEITVIKRSLGWKCGWLKWLPAFHLLSTTYRPGFDG